MKKSLAIFLTGLIPLALFAQVGPGAQFVLETESELVKEIKQSKFFEWVDVDNDGLLDLFVTNESLGSSLYINKGSGVFERFDDGVLSNANGYRGKWGDYDNDGLMDLFILTYSGTNMLFRNKGNGVFEKMNDFAPLTSDYTQSRDFEWVDYDNDGNLDIYVANGNSTYNGLANNLYMNLDGTKFPRRYSGPIVEDRASTSQCKWLDINNDGHLDLIVSNFMRGLTVYVNNGMGNFETLSSFPPYSTAGNTSWGWTDFNGDGLPDVIVAEKDPATLYIAHSDLTFSEIEIPLLENDLYPHETHWGDFDNDGNMDLLLVTGSRIVLFRNEGDYVFKKTELPAFENTGLITSANFVDYNLDGNLDIFLSRQGYGSNGQANVLMTNIGNNNHWLLINLVNSHPNHLADNAKVFLYANEKVQHKSRINSFAKGAANSLFFHFGLGTANKVDSIVVQWGSGIRQVLYDIPANQLLEIEEPPPSLPLVPRELSITVETYRKVTLSWIDATTLESNYILERKKESDDEFTLVAKLQRNTRYYIDFGLEPETKYIYKLYAINKGGPSEAIYQETTTFSAPPVPNAPSNLTETHSAYRVVLSWDLPENTTEFLIERSDLEPDNFKIIATVNADVTTFTDSDVSPKTKYYYRVAASNDGILSEYSNTIEMVTGFIIFTEIYKYNGDPQLLEFFDYNNDDNLDLFSYERFSQKIYYGLDKPTYGLVESKTVDYQHYPHLILGAIGDVDNDNALDFVYITNEIIRIHFSGTGGYRDYPLGMSHLQRIYLKDINNNGKDELILVGTGIHIYTFIGDQLHHVANLFGDERVWEAVFLDYDNDGDLDIIAFYGDYSKVHGSKVFINNNNGTFTSQNFFINHNVAKAYPADYNNDGKTDLLLCGYDDTYSPKTYLYKNNGGGNFEFIANFDRTLHAAWIDYDNDGDLDLILTAPKTINYQEVYYTAFYKNEGNDQFVQDHILDIEGTRQPILAVGDLDKDGDMDIVISHNSLMVANNYFKVYKNRTVEETGIPNMAPSPPAGLNATVNAGFVTFRWDKARDQETPQDGLTYNLVVKRQGTEEFIVSPLSNLVNGSRKVARPGNVGNHAFFNLSCMPEGNFKWSVQTVDQNFNGSAFAPFQNFTITGTDPAAPTEFKAVTVSDKQINLSWKDNAINETGYLIERSICLGNPFNFEFQVVAILPPNSNSYVDYGLMSDFEFSYRVRVYNCSASKVTGSVTLKTFPHHFVSDVILLNKAKGINASFGDYDNDGDLDILLTYIMDGVIQPQARVFNNVDGKYLETDIVLDSTYYAEWLDFNNDGHLDIVFAQGNAMGSTMRVSLNNKDGTFKEPFEISIRLDHPIYYAPAWADYDNDGDIDALFYGTTDGDPKPRIRLLENEGDGNFTIKTLPSPGIIAGRNPWGDYNNDGYLDIITMETSGVGNNLAIYKNNGNRTFSISKYIPGYANVLEGDVDWGDYNGDGYLDLLMIGRPNQNTSASNITVYKNSEGKSFDSIHVAQKYYFTKLTGKWGDFNNDGDLDIATFGYSDDAYIYYSGNEGSFTEMGNYFGNPFWGGTIAFADIDNDGDLDMLHLGRKFDGNRIEVFRNTYVEGWGVPNFPPTAPSQTREDVYPSRVILSWNPGSDDLSKSLSYNVVIKRGDKYVVVPNALANGFRTKVGLGNAGMNHFFIIKGLKQGTYQWAVQSIDNIFQGSPFSEFRSFTLVNDLVTSTQERINYSPRIFPNPTREYLFIDMMGRPFTGQVHIMSLDGKLLESIPVPDPQDVITIDTRKYGKGLRIIRVIGNMFNHVEKVFFE